MRIFFSGPFPSKRSATRCPVLSMAPIRAPPVRARPSAAVAVGCVPWRLQISSTSPVVTQAKPLTLPDLAITRTR